jgi:catechol 2,3-dioxygenase-like lactoylglutathione lyase family enzyme
VNGLLGMRHVALKVANMAAARHFYQNIVGMDVVWEPDPDNVYLSSGSDNLALHTDTTDDTQRSGRLDHIGFLFKSPQHVEAALAVVEAGNIAILKALKTHRDDSVSFYVKDPDGNVVQFLYEPNIARAEAR